MRSTAQIGISAPAELIWEFVTDPARCLHFMAGVTRWECVSEEPRGCGTRHRILMRVGSAEVGGLIETVEYDEPRDLAWNSVTGVDQRGRIRLRPAGKGRTRVEFRLSYGVAGSGMFGWIAEVVSSPVVGANLRRSLQQLKRQVEHEQLRRAVEERRQAKASLA